MTSKMMRRYNYCFVKYLQFEKTRVDAPFTWESERFSQCDRSAVTNEIT